VCIRFFWVVSKNVPERRQLFHPKPRILFIQQIFLENFLWTSIKVPGKQKEAVSTQEVIVQVRIQCSYRDIQPYYVVNFVRETVDEWCDHGGGVSSAADCLKGEICSPSLDWVLVQCIIVYVYMVKYKLSVCVRQAWDQTQGGPHACWAARTTDPCPQPSGMYILFLGVYS
jgi:hypothetical protein